MTALACLTDLFFVDCTNTSFFLQKICEARGWAEGTQSYRDTNETLRKLWTVITTRADTDHDSKVIYINLVIYTYDHSQNLCHFSKAIRIEKVCQK